MPIANYTTKVSPAKSVGEITQMLVKAGARGIATEYDGSGRITALTFALAHHGEVFHYTLPARVDAVRDTLRAQKVASGYLTHAHAESVSWRILKDWVRAQMAIVETEMVSAPQVFLPYLRTDTGETVFDRWELSRALPGKAITA